MTPENIPLHENDQSHELDPISHQREEVGQYCIQAIPAGETQHQLYYDKEAPPDPTRDRLESSTEDLSTHSSR